MLTNDVRDLIPDPVIIVEELDQVIIGQASAKQQLALLLLNRCLLVMAKHGIIKPKSPIIKSNCLLIGPTGCGKTSLVKALADAADLPISINDISNTTASGYSGGDLEETLVRHVKACEDWLFLNHSRLVDAGALQVRDDPLLLLQDFAENGIVFIDEIDKIKQRESSKDKDVNGDMVQNELLKFLDCGKVNLLSPKKDEKRCALSSLITNDTSFILGGAFTGLSDIIEERLNKNIGIGFVSDIASRLGPLQDPNNLLKFVNTEDLIKYGFKPEFLGRIETRAVLEPLTINDLERIITEPKNNLLKRYESLFGLFDIEFLIEKDALHHIAEKAHKMKIGARSLKSIFEKIATPYIFNIMNCPESKIVITRDLVEEALK